MQARTLPQYIRIQTYQEIDGEFVATTDCDSYDHYRSLPDAVEIEGKVLTKTGWSSDRYYACFKTGMLLGRRLDVKG